MRSWFKQRAAVHSVDSNFLASVVVGTLVVLLILLVTLEVVSDAETVSPSAAQTTNPGQTGVGSTCNASRCGGALSLGAQGASAQSATSSNKRVEVEPVRTGAEHFVTQSFSNVDGQRVGLISSNASLVNGTRLVDAMAAAENFELVSLFAAEHGFERSLASGELFDDSGDPLTGLTIYSLYGQTRKPTPEMLAGLDVVVFDLQDVGARYYTYISTLGLAMQAAAEADIKFVVLDRPNPHSHRSEGYVAQGSNLGSFVSQYPIKTLYGLTSGQLAKQIKSNGWLDGLENLDLEIVETSGWSGNQVWSESGLEWSPPSPGLPTVDAAITYPALVQFEATTLSYGQGTELPFGQVGAGWLDGEALAANLNAHNLTGVTFVAVTFVPKRSELSPEPRLENKTVSGVKLLVTDDRVFRPVAVGVYLLYEVFRQAEAKKELGIIDRPAMFDLLAGSGRLRLGLEASQDPKTLSQFL